MRFPHVNKSWSRVWVTDADLNVFPPLQTRPAAEHEIMSKPRTHSTTVPNQHQRHDILGTTIIGEQRRQFHSKYQKTPIGVGNGNPPLPEKLPKQTISKAGVTIKKTAAKTMTPTTFNEPTIPQSQPPKTFRRVNRVVPRDTIDEAAVQPIQDPDLRAKQRSAQIKTTAGIVRGRIIPRFARRTDVPSSPTNENTQSPQSSDLDNISQTGTHHTSI